VNIEYTLFNFIALVNCVPKIIKFGGDYVKFWLKQLGHFWAHHM